MGGWLLIVVCVLGVMAAGTSAVTRAVQTVTQPPLSFSMTLR